MNSSKNSRDDNFDKGLAYKKNFVILADGNLNSFYGASAFARDHLLHSDLKKYTTDTWHPIIVGSPARVHSVI